MLRGWTLRKAAKLAGISHVFLADAEAGRRHLSARRALYLAAAWGVDLALMESAWLDDERERAEVEMANAKRVLRAMRVESTEGA